MKLDRAMEILGLDKTCDFEGDSEELEDAIQLGIEAMKFKKAIRAHTVDDFDALLPGETED